MQLNYVIQKSLRRSMSIQVADDKEIIVKVPLGTPTFMAENFIREKKDWITKQLEKVEICLEDGAAAIGSGSAPQRDSRRLGLEGSDGCGIGVIVISYVPRAGRDDQRQRRQPYQKLSCTLFSQTIHMSLHRM